MKKHIIFIATLLAMTLSSCSDWLDVRGENIEKEENQFSSYKGFVSALTGLYMTMGNNSIYGEQMTMTVVEALGNQWYDFDQSKTNTKYLLTHHDYESDGAKSVISSMYRCLFTTISTANVIIYNTEVNGGNIPVKADRDIIRGEALAVCAYCQFDVLRLFGQLPKGGKIQVSLPYSYSHDISTLPKYYTYSEYVENLKKDINEAEALLKDTDPAMDYSFDVLNSPSNNIFADNSHYYRQSQMNYWAVRALHARMLMYLGETKEAHDIALSIINATLSNGRSIIDLSGISDFNSGYNALPSECLFYLSKYDVNKYANDQLVGGRPNTQVSYYGYYLSEDMLNALYESLPNASASHNRYNNLWNTETMNNDGEKRPTLKKYWYDENNVNTSSLITKRQIVPMLRLSEMYLIAIEGSESLEEAQNLYNKYMSSCQFTLYEPFTSLADARAEIENEYRREFIGEGQAFFMYKRLGKTKMYRNGVPTDIEEKEYILPLPSSEYDPNATGK